MVSVLGVSVLDRALDRAFDPHSGQIKCNKIGICCFSAHHTALEQGLVG